MEKINKIKTGLEETDELKELSKKSGLEAVFATVQDSSDVWKSVREYVLSRIKERYDTTQEMQDDVNEKFKSVMESIQNQYEGWYDGELLKNPTLYNIEILGEDRDIVDENQMNLNNDDNEIIDENEMNDNNDEINLDEEEGF